MEAVKADAGLQEKLKSAGDADAVVEFAKAAGFAISAEELEKAQAELSDEELAGAAGVGVRGEGRGLDLGWRWDVIAPTAVGKKLNS